MGQGWNLCRISKQRVSTPDAVSVDACISFTRGDVAGREMERCHQGVSAHSGNQVSWTWSQCSPLGSSVSACSTTVLRRPRVGPP